MTNLITRAEAKASGLKRYFTGKPCARAKAINAYHPFDIELMKLIESECYSLCELRWQATVAYITNSTFK